MKSVVHVPRCGFREDRSWEAHVPPIVGHILKILESAPGTYF